MVKIFLNSIEGDHEFRRNWMLHADVTCDHCGYNTNMGYFGDHCPQCGTEEAYPLAKLGEYTIVTKSKDLAEKLEDEFNALTMAAKFLQLKISYSYFISRLVVYFESEELRRKYEGGRPNLVFQLNRNGQLIKTAARSSTRNLVNSDNNGLLHPLNFFKTLL